MIPTWDVFITAMLRNGFPSARLVPQDRRGLPVQTGPLELRGRMALPELPVPRGQQDLMVPPELQGLPGRMEQPVPQGQQAMMELQVLPELRELQGQGVPEVLDLQELPGLR